MKLEKFSKVFSCLVLGAALVSSSSTLAYTFGSAGYDGSNGSGGRDGYSGTDQTLFVKGQQLSLQLSGEDGSPGYDGGHGGDASSCYFYGEPSNNMEGAPGGDGGRGGDGGSGGRGGNVTTYYKNIQDLQNIFVESRGGRGSSAGRGGAEGYGCNCPRYSWQVRQCHTENGPDGHPHEECHYDTYYCSNGRSGYHGRDGSGGGDGSWGLLTIIKRDAPLPAEYPTLRPRLADMPEKVFRLSQHKWISHSQGARSLLASGSELRDGYYEFDYTLERQFALKWESPRPVEQFNSDIPLQITDTEVLATYPKNWWIDFGKKTEGSLTTHTVKNLVTQEEAENVHIGDIKSHKQDLTLDMEDGSGQAALINTSFRISYESWRFLYYKNVFTGDVPAELVTRNGNTFTIAVGKLKIPANDLLFRKSIKIIVTIKRSFAGRETSWVVSKKFKI